jgi:serine/threonine-protein kinase
MGDIISQEPAGDTEVSEDTVVTLTVSTGSENEGVEVPELTGLTHEEAVTKLKDLKLNLGEVSLSYHDTVPSGQIIAQDLDPKLRIPEGTSINVTISQGVPTDEEEENSANGTIMINNPLAADQESGQLRVEAINASGNSSGLYDQFVTQETFANGGLEISYPSSTVKIRVYLDGNEVFVRDIN